MKSRFPNFRIKNVTSKIRKTATNTGINKVNKEVPIAVACSPVATTAFPVPPVSLVEASRVRTVPPWTVAAAPLCFTNSAAYTKLIIFLLSRDAEFIIFIGYL